MSGRSRAEQAQWDAWRAGKGPKPPPRAKRPCEVPGYQATAPVPKPTPPPPDPLERDAAKRREAQLRGEHARMVEQLREERARNAFVERIGKAAPTHRIDRAERRSGMREMTAVVFASDLHVEETIEPEKVAFRNEWNLDLADASLTRLFRGAIDLVKHHRGGGTMAIRDVVFAFGGDLLSGWIHEELQETNQLSPIETALWLRPRLAAGLRLVLNELDLRSLVIPVSHGNHGRTGAKIRVANGAETNYEWLLGRILEGDFADDKRVRFDTSPAAHQYVDIYGFTQRTTHGDSLRFAGGVGGVSIPFLKAIPAWNEVRHADWTVIGHWHRLTDVGAGLINGSLCGYSPYSLRINAPFEEPKQIFFLVDSTRGRCMNTPIWTRDTHTTIRQRDGRKHRVA